METPDPNDPNTPAAEELIEDLNEIVTDKQSSQVTQDIQDLKELLTEATDRGIIDSRIRKLDFKDTIEAAIGSVIFASPLLVEDGVLEIGSYLYTFSVFDIPIFLLLNTIFVIIMTYLLLEWTGRDRIETHRIFGMIPTRLVITLIISFLVSVILMTSWGRIEIGQSPLQTFSQVSVLWTAGSLGAALGDILSDTDPVSENLPSMQSGEAIHAKDQPTQLDETELTDAALIEELYEQFNDLEATVQTDAKRKAIQEIRSRTHDATTDRGLNERIKKYTSRDIAEAFVGSIFFMIPLTVEDGVFEVANHLLSLQVGSIPVFLLLHAVFVLITITTLVYWAGPNNVVISRPIFGIIPRRLVGIATVSFLTAGAMMTMWGRVLNWQQPLIGVARVSVVWTVAAFGASLGDILPGESSGDDINDNLSEISDKVENYIE
ncbi:MAG: DUF2391 family protein [Halobacteriaceae archaeon]